MALVNVLSVDVLENPAPFCAPFRFNITFECLAPLEDAETERFDQVLDSIMVGPVPVGINHFVFEADPPDPLKIPPGDVRGVTVLLLVCAYLDQEFVRIGYYIDNDYEDETLRLEPPTQLDVNSLRRNILADKPRVTRFGIVWDGATFRAKGGMALPEELAGIVETCSSESDL